MVKCQLTGVSSWQDIFDSLDCQKEGKAAVVWYNHKFESGERGQQIFLRVRNLSARLEQGRDYFGNPEPHYRILVIGFSEFNRRVEIDLRADASAGWLGELTFVNSDFHSVG